MRRTPRPQTPALLSSSRELKALSGNNVPKDTQVIHHFPIEFNPKMDERRSRLAELGSYQVHFEKEEASGGEREGPNVLPR